MKRDGRKQVPTNADRSLRHEQGSLAAAIRQARKRAGMSQVELAELLGIRQSSVSQWERGATEPSTHNLVDLMRRLPGLAAALSATTVDQRG